MGETPASSAEILRPGNIIELDEIADLAYFEDFVAHDVDPQLDAVVWATRGPVSDLIRPANFNGRIVNIKLQVMDEAYERLLDAAQRGWKMPMGSGGRRLTSGLEDQLSPRYRGFDLIADGFSTGRGMVGQIQAELWYYPLPPVVIKAGTVKKEKDVLKNGDERRYSYIVGTDHIKTTTPTHYQGQAIRRVVAKPRREKDSAKFLKLHEESRRIGIAVLRHALAHTTDSAFHN